MYVNQLAFKCLPTWSSLVEGDEQLDRPNSQITMEFAVHVLLNFLGFNINKTAFCLGRSMLPRMLRTATPDSLVNQV